MTGKIGEKLGNLKIIGYQSWQTVPTLLRKVASESEFITSCLLL